MSARRYLQTVTPPDNEVTGGRPKLYAYGLGYVAELARVTRRSVRRAVEDGRLDPSDPVSMVSYALTMRGHRDTADAARAALGADQ